MGRWGEREMGRWDKLSKFGYLVPLPGGVRGG
jgi:hypothetical protein